MTLPAGYVSTWEQARFLPQPRFERRPFAPLTTEEAKIIETLERINGGRKLTPQEINLSLEQARAIGEL
jgi:hypothetical protein